MPVWTRLEDGPATVSEKNPRLTMRFLVRQVSDIEDIDVDIRSPAYAPAKYQGLHKLDYSPAPEGAGVYSVDVEYGLPDADNPPLGETPLADQERPEPQPPFDGQGDDGNPPDNDSGPSQTSDDSTFVGPEMSIEISRGTVKVLQSKETREGYGINGALMSTGGVPDYQRAINVTAEGVEGVEIGGSFPGKVLFTYNARYRFITWKYLDILTELCLSTNTGTYFGREEESVLYIGSTGNHDGSESPWKFAHTFAIGKHESNIAITGDVATPATSLIVATKKAFDYLWCSYTKVPGDNKLLTVPDAAYVERMFDKRNLKPIGI